MRILSRGATALVLAALVAAVAPAAHAETWRTTDRSHDVRVLDVEDGPPTTAVPRQRAADITAVQVDHGTRWLTVTVTLRDVGAHDRIVTVPLDLPGPATGELTAYRFGRTDGADAVLHQPDMSSGCRARAESFPGRDVVRVAVRRSCLGDPAWVRANASTLTGSRGLIERSRRLFFDAALGPAVTESPTYGPRVYPG